MNLGLSEALPALVQAKYTAAKAAASLIFSSTELAVIRTTTGVPFQLRYCPALPKKPTQHDEPSKPPAKKPDPFDNPPANLLIANVPPSDPTHLLVLNKYPVIAEHFILATKINKAQTHLLEQEDLEATLACLKAWENEGGKVERNAPGLRRKLFAFFNSGEHSGASQPHRHIQFLPVENMLGGKDGDGWRLLTEDIVASSESTQSDASGYRSHPSLPFIQYGAPLPSNPTASQLHRLYLGLYEAAAAAIRTYIKTNPGNLELHDTEGGSAPISYNLAMTTSGMAICPRKREGDVLQHDNGTEVGSVALNGTILGGTLMVKAQEEWDLLKSDPKKLDALLEAIGIPQQVCDGDSGSTKL